MIRLLSSPAMDVLQEVLRIRTALREALRKRGLSHREVERRLGLSRGRLSRLLGGPARLSLQQVLEILAAAELPPEAFFSEVYGLRPGGAPRGSRSLGGIPMERWLEEFEQMRERIALARSEEASAGDPPDWRRG